jgi:hypothetical protein
MQVKYNMSVVVYVRMPLSPDSVSDIFCDSRDLNQVMYWYKYSHTSDTRCISNHASS